MSKVVALDMYKTEYTPEIQYATYDHSQVKLSRDESHIAKPLKQQYTEAYIRLLSDSIK